MSRKAIADTVHSMQQLRLGFRIHRVANDQDVAAQGGVGSGWIVAPDGPLDLFSRDDSGRGAHELLENAHAGRRERYRSGAAPDEQGPQIESKVSNLQDASGAGRSAHESLQSRLQFQERKRLRHVVVGPGVKAAELVRLRVSGREHDDWNVPSRGVPQAPA